MKASFKYIVFGIIFLLIAVFIFQLFWLRGLYQSILKETENTIVASIEKADQDELFKRMLDYSGNNRNSRKSISYQPKKGLFYRTVKIENAGKTSIEKKDHVKMSAIDFFGVMKSDLHKAIDGYLPPVLRVLYEDFLQNLRLKNINIRVYGIQRMDIRENKILQYYYKGNFLKNNLRGISYKRNSKNGKYEMSVFVNSIKSIQVYNYVYSQDFNSAYVVFVEPLTRAVLTRMSGILISTFLIMVILCFAFGYLIRTVVYQRTLEEMKDDFTNNMTHELKTPIAVAYSATDALLNFGKGENPETRNRYLRICRDQLQNLTRLVEQILSINMEKRKTFSINKEFFPIKEVINNLIVQYRLKYDKNVIFKLIIEPEDLQIFADKVHLNNILSNLIDNSIKYSGDKVVIVIESFCRDGYYVIKVRDDGIGISSDKMKHIFEKFYRVPHGNVQDVKGYGLGLFYVKTMVEKQGGTIEADSSPGLGSEFTLKLPAKGILYGK